MCLVLSTLMKTWSMLGNFICQYSFWQRPSNDVTLQMFIWSCNIWLQSVNQAPYMRILKSTECILHHFLYSKFTRMLTWKRFYRYAKSTLSSRNHVYSFTYTVDYTDVSKFFLTYWGRDKMAAIFQTSFSIAFSWMKMYEFRIRFHWNLFLRVKLTIFQHWFK